MVPKRGFFRVLEKVSVVNTDKKKRTMHQFSKISLYMSVVTAVLSVSLAILLLKLSILLLFYFLTTLLITMSIFALKVYIFSFDALEQNMAENTEETEVATHRKAQALMSLLTIALVIAPFVLVMFLDPYTWFTLSISIMSSMSISQLVFYLYGIRR